MNVLTANAKRASTDSISLLGFRVNALRDGEVVDLISRAICEGEHWTFAHHNSHSLYLWDREPQMREFYARADYVLIDGMSLILLGRITGLHLKREDRATSLDFMPLLLPRAAKEGWRIFYLGSRLGVAERAAEKLRATYPGVQMRTHHGYFNPSKTSEENGEVLNQIKAYAPHILLVGMGMPRQEKWIFENRAEVTANIITPCGAHMDYIAGEIPTAPRWLALIYLEWLYRLIAEPKRLWRRYLVEPWFLIKLLVRELILQTPRNTEQMGTDTPGEY
jgi:N-acetylglucosaminyldiphosphoundecaprenol N-acetyl-beta-D-mannosaminyltransferase